MNASRQSALLRVLATTIAIVLVASCGGTPEPQVRVEQQTVVVPQQIKETVVVEQQVVVTPTQAPRAALVEDIAARPDGRYCAGTTPATSSPTRSARATGSTRI